MEDLLRNVLESEAKAKCCEIYKGHSMGLVEWMSGRECLPLHQAARTGKMGMVLCEQQS